ncbi:BSD domain-containing protein [Massarina eburnea CBS 473.64]|uniref:BSD domain-containing protein n=1 Tax=Massarina eburnea CBS 473.64 TaxID=1395130 RepID=A0A6A6S0Y3_9PLEO|nr:BSD domain-containing protein [Massarina eburnea CBS 473.64]
MDSAYDHIQEESYPEDRAAQARDGASETAGGINNEFQDAYKAISSSPWAARLGGFIGTVKKQGEQYYDTANKQATAGLTTLISHTRNLSVNAEASSSQSTANDGPADAQSNDAEAHPARPDSLPADIVKEAEGMLSRFRAEAAKRLKNIEKAEDAADEALLKFGTNIRSYLRDAVTIAPPSTSPSADPNEVLYESKDSSGKKVVHATRFDAQLHVIHSNLDNFLKDPVSPQWESWCKSFDVEKKTDDVAKDLEKHEELRSAMERLVPEKVEYAAFWMRYYFLRHVIESEEQRRREMLKASAAPTEDEEVRWDEDSSDSEEEEEEEEEESSEEESDEDESDDEPTSSKPTSSTPKPSQTPNKPALSLAASKETLKPAQPAAQPRKSDEKSVADSDASYDLVSGATSRAPGSPQDKKKAVVEESDEEDWE